MKTTFCIQFSQYIVPLVPFSTFLFQREETFGSCEQNFRLPIERICDSFLMKLELF